MGIGTYIEICHVGLELSRGEREEVCQELTEELKGHLNTNDLFTCLLSPEEALL